MDKFDASKMGSMILEMGKAMGAALTKLMEDLKKDPQAMYMVGGVWVVLWVAFWFIYRYTAKPWAGRVGDEYMSGDDMTGDDMTGDELTGDEMVSAADDPILSAVHEAVSAVDEMTGGLLVGKTHGVAHHIVKKIMRKRMTWGLYIALFLASGVTSLAITVLGVFAAAYAKDSTSLSSLLSSPSRVGVAPAAPTGYRPYQRSSYAPPPPRYNPGRFSYAPPPPPPSRPVPPRQYGPPKSW